MPEPPRDARDPLRPEATTAALNPDLSRPSGRLGVLTGVAIAAATVPIPFLPDRLVARVRGAVAHDVVTRHGLSLTSEARAVFASADRDERATAMIRKAVELAARGVFRRIGPLGALTAAARGLEVFALGFLLERYIARVRPGRTVRVHVEEARKVRAAIDRAVFRSVAPTLRPTSLTLPGGAEDLRDEYTRWLDALLLTGAALPGYVERRLEAAFDEVVLQSPELYNE
jgi:hypothetical protein